MDDRRFRTLLRSALALSLTTPVVLIACGEDLVLKPLLPEDGVGGLATEPGMDAAADIDAMPGKTCASLIPEPVTDCDAATAATNPTGWWDGGIYQGRYYDAGDYSGRTDRVAVCGCGELPPSTPSECLTYRQISCGQVPVGAQLSPEQCAGYCACTNSAGQALSGCRGLSKDGGVPFLECAYLPRAVEETCGCAELPERTRYGCGGNWSQQLPCELADAGSWDEARQVHTYDWALCDKYCQNTESLYGPLSCFKGADPNGAPFLKCNVTCIPAGRRPDGLIDAPAATGTSVGAWLANTARMEAASVDAFVVLGDELLRYGAPSDLVDRARRAEADEVRHARMTTKLARRYGADEGAWSARPEVKHPQGRSLEAIAIENAVEGCVNETYAALLAMWQAERAREKPVRDVMRQIAEDESRHAALAWSVAEWITPKLGPESRARVDAALMAAVANVESLARSTADRELLDAGLLPSPEEAVRLVEALSATLWRMSAPPSFEA